MCNGPPPPFSHKEVYKRLIFQSVQEVNCRQLNQSGIRNKEYVVTYLSYVKATVHKRSLEGTSNDSYTISTSTCTIRLPARRTLWGRKQGERHRVYSIGPWLPPTANMEQLTFRIREYGIDSYLLRSPDWRQGFCDVQRKTSRIKELSLEESASVHTYVDVLYRSMERVLDRKPMVSMPAEVSYSFPGSSDLVQFACFTSSRSWVGLPCGKSINAGTFLCLVALLIG